MTRNYIDKGDGNGQSRRGATCEPWLKGSPFLRQTWTTVSPFWASRTASLWSMWARDLP
jgi:hypothetical protein